MKTATLLNFEMAFAFKWCILDLLTLYHLFYTKTLYLLLKSLSTHPSHFIDQLHLIISYQKILNIETMHFHSCFFFREKKIVGIFQQI